MAKELIGSNIGSYTFSPGASGVGTVSILGLKNDLTLDQILVITNTTDGEIIYNFADSDATGTISSNVLTLNKDTSTMSGTDELQIWVQINDDEYRTKVETFPGKESGAITSYGVEKSAFERNLNQYKFSLQLIQILFIQSITGSSALTIESPNTLVLTSGTTASSGAKITSKPRNKHTPTKGLILKTNISWGSVSAVDNERRVGLYDDNNGYFLELKDGFIYFVTRRGGVDTRISSSTWDIPVTPNSAYNLWYIQSQGPHGDFVIWYNETLVHRVSNLGVISNPSFGSTDLPLRIENTNLTNTTDVTLKVAWTSVSIEGEESLRLTDGEREILLTSDRRLQTQGLGLVLMSQNFDVPIVVPDEWVATQVGGGTYSQSTNTYTLSLNTTTAINDDVRLDFAKTNLKETVGSFAEYEIGARFGTNLVSGNVREWGYVDALDLNGVFFRIDGPDLQLVIKKGGVESITDLSSAIPNSNFHLYKLEHKGSGKISAFIDTVLIADYGPAQTSQVGSAEKKPFLRMYNTTALASTPSPSEFHWVRLIDQVGNAVTLEGVGDDNIRRFVAVNASRRLLVSQEPPAVPPGNTPVKLSAKGDMSGTQDVFQAITTGKTLYLTRLSGGAETSNAGHIIEAFYLPAGVGGAEVVIEDIYVNSQGSQKDLNESYPVGDGVAGVVLRRRAFGGGQNEVTGILEGYEE